MLNFFTKRMRNVGYVLIALSLFVLQIFSANFPVDVDVWQKSAPLAKLFFEFIGLDLLQNKFFDFALSTPMVLFQLILVYNIISRIRNLEKYNIIITWFYCWLVHLFPAWTKLSPPLIALTILLFILYRLYNSFDGKNNQFIFTISSLLGFSFLFWYPSILLLPFLCILLFQYNAFSLKRAFILLLSFCVPIIWFCCYYIFLDDYLYLIYKFSTFHISEIQFEPFALIQAMPIFILSTGIVIGGLQTFAFSTKTAKLSRLFINSQMALMLMLSLAFSLSINKFTYSFQLLILPFSFFLAMFINIFKRPIIAELVHIILILAVIFNFAYLFWF